MAKEIERKFLVCGNYRPYAFQSQHMMQGYLSSVPERTVRVRIKEDKAYLTIKGPSDDSGRSRYEWEKEIPTGEARELLLLCEPGIIHKIRYYIKVGKHIFEVDEFYGENEGLVLAEVELSSSDEKIEQPSWLGKEVTKEARYYNASLVKFPFKNWPENKLSQQ